MDYATIYLFIEEVQEYTPVAEKTAWERISEGFADSLEGIAEGAVDITVWVLANSPYLLIWAIVIAGGMTLVRRLRRGKQLRRKKKEEPKSDDTKA